jgi:hypothetical protein
MNIRVVLFVALFAFALGGFSLAQDNANSDLLQPSFKSPNIPDPGIPDTVRVVPASYPLGTTAFAVEVTLFNDEELGGFNLPITWDSPDIVCDSVSFVGTRVDYVSSKLFSIDTLNQRLQAGIIIFFEEFLQPGDGLIYTAHFSVNPGAADQEIYFDSTFYPPGGNFALTTGAGQNFIPQMSPNIITYGNPPTDPTISLDPTSFTFTATEGDVNPADQVLNITNSGVGTLNWTASNNSAWLTLDPTAGAGDGSTTLSVDITGLAAGTYYDTVTVSDPAATNDPQKAPVTLTVEEPPPTIALSPGTFEYTIFEGGTIVDDQLDITNTGGGTLDWTAGNLSAWLTLDPTSGLGDATVTMSFDVSGLVAGVYYDTITVSDPAATNNPQKATVQLTVNVPPPVIVLSPTSFTFVITEGDALPNDQLSITNSGGGDLNWTASNLSGWLTLDPTGGIGDASVTISFDVAALTPGTYYDTITVSDPAATNDPQKSAVMLTVNPPPPTISLDPTSFTYAITEGNGLPDDQLTISNVGGSVLNWTASNNSVWLALDPTSGSGGTVVTLSFDVAGLVSGTYYDTITVSDPNATNNPQKAPVMLTVTAIPIPVLSVTPAEFTFDATEGGANPPAQTLTVDNVGDGSLDWTASEDAGWLNVDPTTGSDGDSSAVTVDMTGLTPGTYVDTITITDPLASNSPVHVPVTFNIEALPIIVLDPTSIEVTVTEGDAVPTEMISILNGGGGSLNWTAAKINSWLLLNPTSGTDDDSLIAVDFDLTGLAVGTYYDTITVTDPTAANSPQTVPVTLTINPPPPVIALDPTEINLFAYENEAIPDFFIDVTNTGGSTLEWTASNQTGWVSLDPVSGTGDGTITVSFNISGILPGEYVDTVFVDDPAAVNTPQYTVISLTVYETDHVEVAVVSAFAGEQVEVAVDYTNATPTGQFTLPLSFVNTDVVCDSVSFQGTRMVVPDESVVTIDNAAGTIEIFGFTIDGPILPAGSGPIARMFFTVAGDAPSQFVPIDTTFIEPDGAFEFTLYYMGDPKTTLFTPGGIDISDTPCFEFPTDTVAFEFDLGGIVPSISFPITNSCGGVLEWSVTDGVDWLYFIPTSGTQYDEVTFNIDTIGMSPGSYVTTATFESNGLGTPYDVVVTLNLRAVPIISLQPEIIDFGQVCGGEVLEGSFDINNTGTAILEWHAETIDAVVLSHYDGIAPWTVSFSINTDLLAYGHHDIEVVVSSDSALNSPQILTLKLFVVNCDECTFDIADVDGAQGIPVGVPIYSGGVTDVAGLQFNISYDPALVTADSVTSTYMDGPTIGMPSGEIHYIWTDIINPITVPNGDAIMTLWVTPIGDIGAENCFAWIGDNEITDPYGIPYEGVIYCGGCLTVISPFFGMSGSISYYDFIRPIPDVTVDLSGDDAASTTTDDHGEYTFADLSAGNYMIEPSRGDNDPGVSIADAIKVERHLAFVEEFDSPFKMIAADVNLSDNVSVADVVKIKRYLAELEDLPNGNWTFVDADFDINMSNWYDAPRYIDAVITDKDLDLLDFVGVRMGDVNNTWSQPASSKAMAANVELTIPDLIAAPSDDIDVPIVVANFNAVAGIEIHVSFDIASVTVDSITSSVMPDPTVNAVDGRAHIIWGDFTNPLTLADGETLATIHFHILPTASGDVPLEFMANCELTDEIGDPYPLGLTNGKLMVDPLDVDDETSNLPMAFELKQNYPNPFNPATTISYTVDKTMSLALEIYNVSGQVVERIDLGRKVAGTHTFNFSGENLASGLYTYRLIGEGVSVARQMMLVK